MVRLNERLRPYWPQLKAAYTVGTRIVAPATGQISRLRGGLVPREAVDTLEEAARTSGGRCLTVREPEVERRTAPPGRPPGHHAFSEQLRELVPRVALAELPGGRVLGEHAAVITGRGALVWELSQYFGTSRPNEHPLYLHPFPPAPVHVDGRLGVLASRAGAVNYYHFLMDVLPRLGILEQCPAIDPPPRWYVPSSTRYHRELLAMMGIDPSTVVDSTEVPHVRADTLVVPGLPATDVKNPGWVVRFLRDRLRPADLRRVPGRNIYVTRDAGRNNRAVVGEADLIRVLEDRGFVTVDPGSMSVADQIQTFAEADIIVSAHGAALANLVFASEGAMVIELFPAGHIVPDYWKLAGGVPGLQYRYLAGLGATDECDRARMLITDIEVDIPALLEMIDER